MRTTLTLQSDSTGTGGVVLFANPLFSLIDLGYAVNGVTAPSISGYGGTRRFTSAYQYVAMSTPALLGAEFQTFRVVGCGFRISNPQPEATAKGRIYIAPVPLAQNGVPGYNALENFAIPIGSTTNDPIFGRMGLPPLSICDSPAIQALPDAQMYTVGDLIEANVSIELNTPQNHPDCFDFKTTYLSNAWTSTTDYGESAVSGLSTGVSSPLTIGAVAPTQSNGTSAFIVYYEGFPNSLTEALLLEIEMHLEVSPSLRAQSVSSTSGLSPVPDSIATEAVGTTMAVEAVLAAEHKHPCVRSVPGHGATGPEFMNRHVARRAPRQTVEGLVKAAKRFM